MIYLHLFINRTLMVFFKHLYWNVWYLKMLMSPNLKFPFIWCVPLITYSKFYSQLQRKVLVTSLSESGGWPQVCVWVCVFVWVCFFFFIQLHFFRISLTEGKQMDAAEVCGKNMTNVTGRRRFKPGKCPDRNGDIMYDSPLWVYASLCGLRAVTTWVKRRRCSNKLAASLAVVARSVVAFAAFRDSRKSEEVVNTVVVSEMKTWWEQRWSCDDSTDDRWASTLALNPDDT